MTDWFRSWHGAPMDPKWILIARKADVTPAVASAIAWALFDHASQATPRGNVSGFDCEVYAAWGGLETEAVEAVVAAMRTRGMILDDSSLASWSKRQPEREDGSAERTKAWRERKNAGETAIETARTQPNATERNRPTDKRRVDTDTLSLRSRDAGAEAIDRKSAFEKFWKPYPEKVGKPAAERAFAKHFKEIDAITAGLERYIRDKPPDRQWLNPATFLNQQRWLDEPAKVEPKQSFARQTNVPENRSATAAARRLYESALERERQSSGDLLAIGSC